jgi:hypothetical protein
MAKRSPGMGIALANARMNLKHGSPLSPEDCCREHDRVKAKLKEADHRDRFAPLPNASLHQPEPVVAPGAVCDCLSDPSLLRSAALAAAVCKAAVQGATYVYIVEKIGDRALGPKSFAFLSAWSWYSTLWVVQGLVIRGDRRKPLTFELTLPLRPQKLLFCIAEVLKDMCTPPRAFTVARAKNLTVCRHNVKWDTLSRASILAGSRKTFVVKARAESTRPAKRPREAEGVVSDPLPLAAADEVEAEVDGDDQVGPDAVEVEIDGHEGGWLEAMLGEIIVEMEAEQLQEPADEAGPFGDQEEAPRELDIDEASGVGRDGDLDAELAPPRLGHYLDDIDDELASRLKAGLSAGMQGKCECVALPQAQPLTPPFPCKGCE